MSAKRPVHPTQMQWLKYCIRGQVRSYQTTYNLLKKLGFVGADRAAFRLSAKRPVHPTHMRWLKHCIRGQVRSHDARCLMRDSATSKTWWRLPQERVHSADYVLFDKRGGLPAICREPAARPAHAVCQIKPRAAAQPIAAVVTSESSNAPRAKAELSAISPSDRYNHALICAQTAGVEMP